MSNAPQTSSQAISLPKGGGAIKGIGETFQPNLFSGTGNHSIPIATSPGRSSFGPALSLQYSSGNGNGPFGLGWQLSIPRITRKTERGLPQYHDDTDVFVMSGAEDLVPAAEAVPPIDGYAITRYRPRTEGLFARIEKWTKDGNVHWRATTKENITSVYGGTSASRIADPEDERRVYEWLLQETFDAKGNHILYEYARDNPQLYNEENPSLRLNTIYDQNRNASQLYIRRIYYGNLPNPLLDEHGNPVKYPDGTEIGHLREGRRYAFEVVFDYGDWEIPTKDPHPDPVPAGQQELFGPDSSIFLVNNAVPIREDPFSSFRARFEIRTLRRCRRVLMFHHFAELKSPTLVRSTDFEYWSNPETLVSFLTSVTVTGYQRDTAGVYKTPASMPPITFKYSEFRPHEQRYQSVAAQGNDMPPRALNDPNFALVDLFGDGLPDVLHTSPAGFRYWKNLGGGLLDRPRVMPQIPAGIALSEPGVGFGDMGGDGRADLLVHSGPLPGFFETTSDGTWQKFKPYDTFPGFDLADPNVRMVDLTGDGLSDALMTRDHHFLWFECLGEKGFAAPKHVERKYDLDEFPDVYFNDPSGRVRLADMTGDGLNDIVLVHNGRIDYWPNLGYGNFGKRITMANAPRLEFNFDPKRLFLADLDGTGCADLVYVDFDRVLFWFNQSGNKWSDRQAILGTPIVSDVDSLQFADVFGTGTATLLWSYDYNFQFGGNYKALDFCGGIKPYVLTEMSNNMGATTRVSYAPSTKYFLEDQANGTPWATRLPFPVHVVDKVEVIDHVSKTKLVTTYKYHHGYFDGREREFRGFGRVDQFDTETFEDFTQASLHDGSDVFSNNNKAYHVSPVETRSWFHTGVYFDEDRPSYDAAPFDYKELTKEFRKEFYKGDGQAVKLDDHEVETGETPHEAYRALRGSVLRTEVYGRDGTDKAIHPYLVTESRYRVKQLQPKDGNHHAVYLSSQMESLSYHYERNPTDPRVGHALTLEVDTYGNVLKSLAIGYGRRHPDPDLPLQADRDKQTQTLITYTENSYTNAIDDPVDDPDNYRTPLPSEARTYELTGFQPADNAKRFSFGEWVKDHFALLALAGEIKYEETADLTTKQKRLIEHVRTLYRKNDLTDLLPLDTVESLALPGESYKLAFTPGLLNVYTGKITPPDLRTALKDEGKYVDMDNNDHWWIPSGRAFYSPDSGNTPTQELTYASQHFFLAHRFRDPFGNTATVRYDVYDLLVAQTADPLGNTASAEHDYRLLQPFRMTDPNGNRAAVAFDTLGMVAGTAIMGKPPPAPVEGDSLEGFEPDLTQAQVEGFYDVVDPHVPATNLLKDATTRIVYDLDRFRRSRDAYPQDPDKWEPVFAATLARETHVSDSLPPQGLKIQISFSYSDGFGREIQKKIQAEPGPVPTRDATRKIIVGADGQPQMTPNDVSPRWVGSGWTIFNNKGKPIRQYEPFFTDNHRFEFDVRIGVSPILFYDPVERVVATLHPNHTYEKIDFDPWRQQAYDVNDTINVPGNPADPPFDPKNDSDVGHYFRRLPDDEYLPTWYDLRTDAAKALEVWSDSNADNAKRRTAEKRAANKAIVHANTPTVAHLDTLGRPFLTVAINRFERKKLDNTAEIIEEPPYHTRIELDIEGNQRALKDERKKPDGTLEQRIVMRYDYDMLGNKIHQLSMEAGARWMSSDVTGKPIYALDSRDHRFRTAYDPLRRPTDSFLREGAGAEMIVGRSIYGESRPNPEASNLRGKVVQIFDQAGVVTSDEYDFKGNLLRSQRQLAELVDPQVTRVPAYKTTVDWSGVVQLEVDTYTSRTAYDALNRPVTLTTPHTPAMQPSVIRPGYNEANLLERVEANLRGAIANGQPVWTPFVSNIDYDAKGQRQRIDYGNGASTLYDYDPLTFRLTRLYTRRGATFSEDCDNLQPPPSTIAAPDVPPPNAPCGLQNLSYTYDPVGNITHIRDDARQTIHFSNQRVEPSNDYIYDAMYRLIEATGREHLGQAGGSPIPHSHNDAGRMGILSADANGRFSPNDRNAMGTYVERYVYDAVGNFLEMKHNRTDAQAPGWSRSYAYAETSLIEDGTGGALLKTSNRLSSTTVNPNSNNPVGEPYLHDAHGNMLRMPQLQIMQWDHKDQLSMTQRQKVNDEDVDGVKRQGERTYYIYDAAGQRVRRITELANGNLKDERIYLGGFEIYRQRSGANAGLVRESLHIMDDKQRIALVETRNDVDDGSPKQLIRYQFGNHLGSASLELDDQAQIISYEEYTPYGSTSYQAVRSQTETPKRYRYSGKERDDETGLYYYRARHYAPWLGRWISCDPAGVVDGTNLYTFVQGNPIRLIDNEGMQGEEANRTPGQTAASIYNGRTLSEPATTLHDDPAFKDIARETWEQLDEPNYDQYRRKLNNRIKEILNSNEPHPLKQQVRVKYGNIVWKTGPFKGQKLNYAHTVGQQVIRNVGADPWLAVEPRNLSPVGKGYHLGGENSPGGYGHPEEMATNYGTKMTPEAKAGLRAYVAERPPHVPPRLDSPSGRQFVNPQAPRGYAMTGVMLAVGGLLMIPALLHATSNIEETTREKGAEMGVAQGGKEAAKIASGLLWGTLGVSSLWLVAASSTPVGLTIGLVGFIVSLYGPAATDALINEATPELKR